MTPPPRFVACRCGHEKAEHDGELAPQCHAPRCECLRYVPCTAKQDLRPRPRPAARVVDLPVPARPPAPREPDPAPVMGACPECGKPGLVNVGAHRARAHGFRREASCQVLARRRDETRGAVSVP